MSEPDRKDELAYEEIAEVRRFLRDTVQQMGVEFKEIQNEVFTLRKTTEELEEQISRLRVRVSELEHA